MLDESKVSRSMKESIQLYVTHGLRPGGFLYAVLTNNLRDAVGRADHNNIKVIPEIVSYIYNNTPFNSQGSEEIVESWMRSR